MRQFVPDRLPKGWREIDTVSVGDTEGIRWVHRGTFQAVIMSIENRLRAGVWWHVSTAFPRRTPKWKEMVAVKEAFMGKETQAIQIHPPRSQWINAHPHCLHLWSRLDEATFPHDLPTF